MKRAVCLILRRLEWVTRRSSKLQTPSSKEAPNFKSQRVAKAGGPGDVQGHGLPAAVPRLLELGAWSFFGIWSLGFGASGRPFSHWKQQAVICLLPLLAMNATGATFEYRAYPSSQDPSLKLCANFIKPDQPRPIMLSMHGWHGKAKHPHPDNVARVSSQPWFIVEPDMRGRGDSTGKPDANGWELQDAVDAVEFAKKEYAAFITTPECIYLTGGSGGGGNTLGLVGKFPDYFCAAVCEAGISDYGLWFEHDRKGEFRDELQGKGWVGGTPQANPEAYASRGGLTTVANLLTPLAITHGELDPRCPIEQARNYVEKAKRVGTIALISYLELKGVAAKGGHFGGISPEQTRQRNELVVRHLATHNKPVEIPPRGRFVVAGYLRTKHFQVTLDSVDHIAELDYDLAAGKFELHAKSAKSAALRVKRHGQWTERPLEVRR
ncbi:MAG: hypothetical protein FJ388_20615, partial [Verrucomicrobia bacterium]|nr:hypothetical protein [Verrucomicrobiota bacterium]